MIDKAGLGGIKEALDKEIAQATGAERPGGSNQGGKPDTRGGEGALPGDGIDRLPRHDWFKDLLDNPIFHAPPNGGPIPRG